VELETLLKNGWELDSGESGIRKTYYFKIYIGTVDQNEGQKRFHRDESLPR